MRQELKDLILNDLEKSGLCDKLENHNCCSGGFEILDFDGQQVTFSWCEDPESDWRKNEIVLVDYNVNSGKFGQIHSQYNEIFTG